MNSNYRGILQLIKSAITRQPEQLPDGFELASQLELLNPHHIFPLIYDGAVRCGIPKASPAMQTLFPIYLRALQKSVGQQRQLNRVLRAFREAGIDHMPLKGVRMKPLYPSPELRYMGDADILIRMEQYEKIVPILKSLGFTFHHELDYELAWDHKELHLELHKCPIAPSNQDFYAYYGNGWQLAVPRGSCEYGMNPEDEWIYLFTHLAKHYRNGGIGCRQVFDLWIWRRTHRQMDQRYIQDVLARMRLDIFHSHMLRLLDYWFENGPGDQVLDIMTDFIFSSGSWGRIQAKTLSKAVRDSKHSRFGGRLTYLWQTAFPSLTVLRDQYRILYKFPWLLPGIWVIRFFRKIFFESRVLKRKFKDVRLLSNENILQRQKMLNLVGLDYHF